MGMMEMALIALGLSMDAFAVSVCKGLSVTRVQGKHALQVGLWFGGFQGLMPLAGFLLTGAFARCVGTLGSWIAFGLLMFIGGNMLREALTGDAQRIDASFSAATMLVLAVATSIDALAVGVTLRLQGAEIRVAAPLIALTTGLLSPVGLAAGNAFGARYKRRAELAGGVVLLGLGVKLLLEGLGVL